MLLIWILLTVTLLMTIWISTMLIHHDFCNRWLMAGNMPKGRTTINCVDDRIQLMLNIQFQWTFCMFVESRAKISTAITKCNEYLKLKKSRWRNIRLSIFVRQGNCQSLVHAMQYLAVLLQRFCYRYEMKTEIILRIASISQLIWFVLSFAIICASTIRHP